MKDLCMNSSVRPLGELIHSAISVSSNIRDSDEILLLQLDKPHQRCPWRQIVCWAGILIGFTVLGIGIAILVVALTFTVQPPIVQMSDVSFRDVVINSTGSPDDIPTFQILVSAVVNATISLTNPNKFHLNVESEKLLISYSGYLFGHKELSGLPAIGPYQTKEFMFQWTFANAPLTHFTNEAMGDSGITEEQFPIAVPDRSQESLRFDFRLITEGNAVHLAMKSPEFDSKAKCTVDVVQGDNYPQMATCTYDE